MNANVVVSENMVVLHYNKLTQMYEFRDVSYHSCVVNEIFNWVAVFYDILLTWILGAASKQLRLLHG